MLLTFPVNAPAELGHPRGWLFTNMLSPGGSSSQGTCTCMSFSAFNGVLNPRLCFHCIQLYTSTANSARDYVLFPFLHLRLIP
ncbi:hypothetical protein V8C42DRAFT_338954 [Trichoderma barbatum]